MGSRGTTSEDCLNLNIYLPSYVLEEGSEPLPVLFYIHGGAFFTGTNDDGNLQGEYLAQEQNVIVVNINYRLAAFGYASKLKIKYLKNFNEIY
jgi:carboxylesterase type B